jgi:hypothetical protein
LFSQASCFYYGSSTVYKVRHTAGSAYLYAIEHRGQWDTDGPPPQAGDITQRPLYGKLQQSATYSTVGTSREYEVSEMLPLGRYLITSIREVGAAREGKDTVHYYEVQFEEGTGGIH